MECGTVEWNGGKVEWNSGIVEWWNGGSLVPGLPDLSFSTHARRGEPVIHTLAYFKKYCP
jgi:hypothetical protein